MCGTVRVNRDSVHVSDPAKDIRLNKQIDVVGREEGRMLGGVKRGVVRGGGVGGRERERERQTDRQTDM